MSLRPTRRRRALGLAALLTCGAFVLTACITEPATASGTGTVTISWSDTAAAHDPVTGDGDVLLLCDAGVENCDPDNAGYAFHPEAGSSSAVLYPGVAIGPMPVGSAARVGLPAGDYALQAWITLSSGDQQGSGPEGDLLRITIGDPATKDRTIWHQSTARTSADEACPRGWTASWSQWPDDRAGGWVCVGSGT